MRILAVSIISPSAVCDECLLLQPMSPQELWQWVHYNYGEELGLTSSDDDYLPPSQDEELSFSAKLQTEEVSTGGATSAEQSSSPQSNKVGRSVTWPLMLKSLLSINCSVLCVCLLVCWFVMYQFGVIWCCYSAMKLKYGKPSVTPLPAASP